MLSSALLQQTPSVCDSLQRFRVYISKYRIYLRNLCTVTCTRKFWAKKIKYHIFTFNFSGSDSQLFCCIRSQNIGLAEALMSMAV
jgi:hypothetical protein